MSTSIDLRSLPLTGSYVLRGTRTSSRDGPKPPSLPHDRQAPSLKEHLLWILICFHIYYVIAYYARDVNQLNLLH